MIYWEVVSCKGNAQFECKWWYLMSNPFSTQLGDTGQRRTISGNNLPCDCLKISMPWSTLQISSSLTEMSDTSKRLSMTLLFMIRPAVTVLNRQLDFCCKSHFDHCSEAASTSQARPSQVWQRCFPKPLKIRSAIEQNLNIWRWRTVN